MLMSAKRTTARTLALFALLVCAAGALTLPGSSQAQCKAPAAPQSAVGVVLAAAPGGVQAPAAGAPQQYCPITGEKIDKSVYVDYQGKRIYFCCAACKPAFLKDPEKVLKEMQDKGVVLEPSPAAETKPAPEQGGSGQPGSPAGHMGH
jgi:YHS domain-containing protein